MHRGGERGGEAAQSRAVAGGARELWLDRTATRVPRKILLGEAIGYAPGQWPILITVLDDGHLEIDNNTTEDAIRSLMVGKKLASRRQSEGRRNQRPALQPDRNRRDQRPGALGLPQPPLRAPAGCQVSRGGRGAAAEPSENGRPQTGRGNPVVARILTDRHGNDPI